MHSYNLHSSPFELNFQSVFLFGGNCLFLLLVSVYLIRYTTGMSSESVSQLLSQRERLLEELSSLTHMLHGSWVERYAVCSRRSCSCHTGKRHGPRYYVVINEDSRQRQKYIPQSQVSAAREGIAQYQRAQEIITEITRINLELIKERAYAGS